MADQYGLVVQGDDDANKLTAHYEFNGNGDDLNFYNIVHGAGGDDIISVNSYVASRLGVELYGEEGNDHISGGALGDTLDGGAGDDQIQALGGDDIINGGAGDDLIISLAGHAVIDGGEDTDTLRTSGNFNRLTVTGVERLEIAGSLTISAVDLQSFEDVSTPGRAILAFTSPVSLQDVAFSQGRFELRGSAGDDLFDVSTRGGTFQILGQAGNDTLVAGLNHASISGGTGDDAITGSDAGDQLNGDGGNDLIHAGGGNDIILAQTGDDTVYGGDGNDVIAGFDLNAGTNNKPKASGDKHWYGEAGNDTFENLETLKDAKVVLSGGDGKDTLIYMGDASNMRVDSIETLKLDLHVERDFEVKGSIEASADFLNSFDRITIAPTYEADITLSSGGKFMWKKASTNVSGEIDGSKQADEIDMTNSKDYWSIDGGKGDDVIKLGAHGELFGGDGNDTLIAGTKGSAMMGGRGRDILVGGIGSDEMTGSGSDTFVFKANGGHDTIYSFDKDGKSADKIDLSAIKGITSYNDLIAHHVHQDAHGVSIALGAGDQIYIYNVAVHDLHASTFIL